MCIRDRDIFEMDEMVQKASSVENVVAVENFMPKKISLPQDWIKNAMKENRKSEKLHLPIRQINM